MNSSLRLIFRSSLYICLVLQFSRVEAQNPTPSPQAAQTPSAKFTEQQMREMAAKLQQRVGKATDEVIGRIKKEEDVLSIRLSYFRKPDRLNPATYTSKDDVEQWKQALQQLKEKA